MIGRLSGLLAQKSPPLVLVDVHGVGYEVDVPMSTFYNLPGLGEKVVLLTHFVVREDAQVLFGFLTEPERATFRLLVKISGVGPRTALSILSGLSVVELAQAVTRQDGARLVKVPGIGKKTAERLLLELKGKLGPDLALPATMPLNDVQSPGLQRTRSPGGAEGTAGRGRRQRGHQAGPEGAEPLGPVSSGQCGPVLVSARQCPSVPVSACGHCSHPAQRSRRTVAVPKSSRPPSPHRPSRNAASVESFCPP